VSSTRKRRAEWLPVLLLVLAWPSAGVHAQPQSVTIPLQYVYTSVGYKLGISVGINGGAPQPYVFDTGSSVFNAAFNPATWNGFGPTVPNATVPKGTGVNYCYGSGTCFTGNLVQVPTLSFYAPGAKAGSPAAASLSANPGYQINADFLSTIPGQPDQHFPSYFQSSNVPPHLGAFYGVFGAGNFASLVGAGATVGGVLGQTIIPGVTQGYVVSANGDFTAGAGGRDSGWPGSPRFRHGLFPGRRPGTLLRRTVRVDSRGVPRSRSSDFREYLFASAALRKALREQCLGILDQRQQSLLADIERVSQAPFDP
jgi:hypothetical protein